jgi:drug/metabolite transporter (DMT)-like permease
MTTAHHPVRGFLLMLGAVAIFACFDTAGKYVMSRYPVPLIQGLRYFISIALVLAFYLPQHGSALFQMQRKPLVILRGASLCAASLFSGLALQRMPVAETVAIVYLAPLLVLLLAGPLLKERVQLASWLAVAAGIVGVVLIARPGGGLDPAGIVFAILCALASAVYMMMSRQLAATETTMALLFYTSLVGAVVFGASVPFYWQGPPFSMTDLLLILFLGSGSITGHLLFTMAYRDAPASLLAPVNYVQIAFAAILGWIVFRHVPDQIALLGMALVGLAGAAAGIHSHFTRKRA